MTKPNKNMELHCPDGVRSPSFTVRYGDKGAPYYFWSSLTFGIWPIVSLLWSVEHFVGNALTKAKPA